MFYFSFLYYLWLFISIYVRSGLVNMIASVGSVILDHKTISRIEHVFSLDLYSCDKNRSVSVHKALDFYLD